LRLKGTLNRERGGGGRRGRGGRGGRGDGETRRQSDKGKLILNF